MAFIEYNRVGHRAIEKTEINDGIITETRKFDVTDEIEYAKRCKEIERHKNMVHVASLPLEIINMWRVREGFDWFTASEAERKAKLNDPDNKLFRVWEGQV